MYQNRALLLTNCAAEWPNVNNGIFVSETANNPKKPIKKIAVSELEVGMYITEANNAWVPDQNFRRQGLITKQAVIEQIKKLGVSSVYIDPNKGKDAAGTSKSEIDANNRQILDKIKNTPYQAPAANVALAEELDVAKEIQIEATALIGRVMTDVKMGRVIDITPVANMGSSMVQSLINNQNALACVTRLREKDRYLMEHSFNVSVLMGILGSAMGYSGDVLHEMVTGALLHDIGKIQVSDDVLHKPGQLTPEEWGEMKNHVTYGEEVLRETPGITDIMLDICAQHHERLDGSGYPRGLVEAELPIHSRMSSVVDVYDAITAERVYHKGMAPTTALRKLLEWSGDKHLDRDVVYRFIQAMGVYPIGSVVELDNRKLAIVKEPNEAHQDKPIVLVVYDLRINRYDNKHVIDLGDARCGRKIVRAVYAEHYGIKLKDFL